MNGITDETKICDEKRVVEEHYGSWTAHNISLGQDIFTIKGEVVGDEVKLRRVVQIVADVCDRPISELRVLDLACLEGMYGIEFSRQGAYVCAIEGREANLEKARFAARVLSLGNIEFHQDDVRNLRKEKYGTFDVVLCLGILYHLDAPGVFTFLENVFAVCTRVAVIDTHISLRPEETFLHKGKTYRGKTVDEYALDASPEEKKKKLWASLDNPTSAYLTRPSLFGLLYDLGFTSVYECHIPQEPQKAKDRATFVAIKGTTAPLVSCPQLPPGYARNLPEESTIATFVAIRRGLRIVRRSLPRGFRRLVKRVLFSAETN
jgi:SAM-dependent methyltransferase